MRLLHHTGRLALPLALGLLFCGQSPVDAAVISPGFLTGVLATQSEYGTIKGRLIWGGDQIPPAPNLIEKGRAPKDPDVCARDKAIPSRELVVDPKTKGIAYGFAYLSKPSGTNPAAVKELLAKRPKAEIDQKNCEFVPYAQGIYQDQPLVIKSSDPVNHNVRYAAFTNPAFNQILAPNAQLEV
jgi:hypothetical protein